MKEVAPDEIDVHSPTWRTVKRWAEEYLRELSGELLEGEFTSLCQVTDAQGQAKAVNRLLDLAKNELPPARIERD